VLDARARRRRSACRRRMAGLIAVTSYPTGTGTVGVSLTWLSEDWISQGCGKVK